MVNHGNAHCTPGQRVKLLMKLARRILVLNRPKLVQQKILTYIPKIFLFIREFHSLRPSSHLQYDRKILSRLLSSLGLRNNEILIPKTLFEFNELGK